jgi:hypothetical protein
VTDTRAATRALAEHDSRRSALADALRRVEHRREALATEAESLESRIAE